VSVSLAPGHATFLDLTGIDAVAATGSQRPEVIGVFVPSPTTAPGVCISGVEGWGRITGYTRVFIPPGGLLWSWEKMDEAAGVASPTMRPTRSNKPGIASSCRRIDALSPFGGGGASGLPRTIG
jgi:hypothetical protein